MNRPQRNLEAELDTLGQSLAPSNSLASEVVAQLKALPPLPRPNSRKRWLVRAAVAIAAILILAVIILPIIFRPTVAFAQVLQNVEQTKTLTCDIEDIQIHIAISGNRMRYEVLPTQETSIGNLDTGQWLILKAYKKTAMKINLAKQPYDLYAWFKDFKDGKEEHVGEKMIDGRKTIGFKVTRPHLGNNPDAPPAVLTFWVDPATSLPIEIEGTADGRFARVTHIQWNQPLDESLFSMAIPPDYKLDDMGGISADQLQNPPTTEEARALTLHRGIGIGQLKFGDSPERITEVLGKPEKITSKVSWDYPSKGFSITVFPKKGLATIMVGSKKAFPVFNYNDFAGKMDNGLAIGSTREQVEAIFGKPQRNDDIGAHTVMLYYDDDLIWFMLKDDHVVQIFLEPPPSFVYNSATTTTTAPVLNDLRAARPKRIEAQPKLYVLLGVFAVIVLSLCLLLILRKRRTPR